MHTPATGFLRSLPDTLSGIEAELVTKRERLIEDLARIEVDLSRVRAILGVTDRWFGTVDASGPLVMNAEALPFANLAPAETLLSQG